MNSKKTTAKILDTVPADLYFEGQPVQIILKAETDLGYKAIVDGKYWGVLYFNEVFEQLEKNQECEAYVKKVRDDGKLDLTLYKTGTSGLVGIAEKILNYLESHDGFMAITDKTDPEDIYDLFGVSKKKFKMAIGGLYKKRIIQITNAGITLLKRK